MTPRNLVDLVERLEPGDFAALQADYPRDMDLLSPAPVGAVLAPAPRGPGSPAAPPKDKRFLARARAASPDAAIALATSGIKALRQAEQSVTLVLSRRLRLGDRLKTWSAVTSALASAGLLASLGQVFALKSSALQLTLASVAFASSCLAIASERLSAGPGGGRLRELFDGTVDIGAKVLAADLVLQRMRADIDSRDDLPALLRTLDDCALRMHAIQAKVGLV